MIGDVPEGIMVWQNEVYIHTWVNGGRDTLEKESDHPANMELDKTVHIWKVRSLATRALLSCLTFTTGFTLTYMVFPDHIINDKLSLRKVTIYHVPSDYAL